MKLIFLATSEANRSLLTSSLYGLGLHEVRCVTTWDALMQALVTDRPQLVILEYFAIAGDGAQALASADWALRAMKIPAIIALPTDAASARTQLEMSTEFEHFVLAPYDQKQLAAVIGDAVGDNSWLNSTLEVPTVDLFAIEAAFEAKAGRSVHEHATVAAPVVSSERDDFGGESTQPRGSFSQSTAAVVEATADEEAFFAAWDQNDSKPPANDPYAQTDAFHDESLDASSGPGEGRAPMFQAGLSDASSDLYADDADPSQWDMPGTEPGAARSAEMREQPAAVAEPGRAPEMAAQARAVVPTHSEVAATETAALEVDCVLPPIEAGEFGEVNVAGVLHALSALGATGRLRLSQATVRREVLIANGTPGREDASTTAAESSRLMATFAWTEGTWVFVPERVMPIGFTPYCHALEFIYRGIEAQLSMNDLARVLGPHFRKYPVWTNRIDRIASVRMLDHVATLLQKFDGQVTFERAMGGLGAGPEEVLRASYFGWISGLLVFSKEPAHAPAHVRYVPTIHGAPPRLTVPESPRRASDTSSAISNAAARAQTTRVTAAGLNSEENRVEKETATRLQAVVDSMGVADAYGVLSLAPGCGVERINDRYYELVRDYHPDRFSKNPQAPSRVLAERIFMMVRNATAEARRLESGDFSRSATTSTRVPSNSGPVASVPSGEAGKARVADVLERLRRNSGSHSAVGGASQTGSFARVPSRPNTPSDGVASGRPTSLTRTQVSQYSPEQMVRNARKLVEASAYDKAAEMLALARTRGVEGPPIDALEEYIGFATEKRTSRLALKRLDELLEAEQNDIEKARIQVLRGHVQRVAGEDADAAKAYGAAAKLDTTNDEAQRWVRHMKMKLTKKPQSESLLDKLRNTKITFPGSKSK